MEHDAVATVEAPPPSSNDRGLALSGGGYRAMLFHIGVLWRLNELGKLQEFDRISSVSGGSFTAGRLGARWDALATAGFTMPAYVREIADPLMTLSRFTMVGIELNVEPSNLWQAFLGIMGWSPLPRQVQRGLNKYLFTIPDPRTGKTRIATLQDFPDAPRFVLNSTNLESGVDFRFSKPYIADYKVGALDAQLIPLAVAVGASAAFPPVLAPVIIKFPTPLKKFADTAYGKKTNSKGNEPMHEAPYINRAKLADGGVYDNLGLQTLLGKCTLIIASDAGGTPVAKPMGGAGWGTIGIRIVGQMYNNVQVLRHGMLVDDLVAKRRIGTYISIASKPPHFKGGYPTNLHYTPAVVEHLAQLGTQLRPFKDPLDHERLVNWGYYMTDLAIKTWVPDWIDATSPVAAFPYPKVTI